MSILLNLDEGSVDNSKRSDPENFFVCSEKLSYHCQVVSSDLSIDVLDD